jgi:RNA polymerase sigma-70 factor (ECF subfamily)
MLQLGESTPQTPTAHAILREQVEGLFEQLHLPIFRYVMCKTRNSWMAEDITQESFLRLYRHLHSERPVKIRRLGCYLARRIEREGVS